MCGKADSILSEVVLGKGNNDADKIIPKDAQGLFITNSNKIFRGYFFEKVPIEEQGADNNEYTTDN